MRITDFVINSFMRYSSVAPDSMAELKGQLNTGYINILNKMKEKADLNAPIEKKLEELNKEINTLDPHAPEYEEKLIQFERLERQLEKPSMMERAVTFFEKPYVRVLLMIGFIFLSRWIAKKITEKKDDKNEDIEEHDQQRQSFYPPPPPQYYQPYGYNPPQYYPPNQSHGK